MEKLTERLNNCCRGGNILIINFLSLLVCVFFMYGCAIQKPVSTAVVLSEKFAETDSIQISIVSTLLNGCIPEKSKHLYIIIRNDKSYLIENMKIENIDTVHRNVITDLTWFEKTANSTRKCGGYAGGKGMTIAMTINGNEGKFGYCQDDWDGINEFLERLRN